MTKIFSLLVLISFNFPVLSQVNISGNVIDSYTQKPLPYVNIGINKKNIGTASLLDGTFALSVPTEYLADSITFSAVGYFEQKLLIKALKSSEPTNIQLSKKSTQLNEVTITADKLVEKKYGVKRRNLLMHFSDGMFQKDDVFEIGQLIRLGNTPAQITSANLYIFTTREDSASFRINFYKYQDGSPSKRIVEKSILQRHPISAGWLRFDLRAYNILLKGDFLVSIEFIPEPKKDITPIYYEIKVGGSRSFYRRNSLGQWNKPPHNFCLYITALVDKNTPEEPDDVETPPAFTIQSDIVKDSFNIFIQLPKGYNKASQKKYPVIYHLDGNAYFNHIGQSVKRLAKKKKLAIEPIIVGIGYNNAYEMDSLRIRDYTFPKALPSDSFLISGGGEKFYQFLKTELIPYIDTAYKTDKTNRTLMGHSFGGYFTLYSLLRDLETTRTFHNFVAASPSISYYDSYLFKKFQNALLQIDTQENLNLYLTIGELEIDKKQDGDFIAFQQMLMTKDYLQLKSKVYNNLGHIGTGIPSFYDGIEYVLKK